MKMTKQREKSTPEWSVKLDQYSDVFSSRWKMVSDSARRMGKTDCAMPVKQTTLKVTGCKPAADRTAWRDVCMFGLGT